MRIREKMLLAGFVILASCAPKPEPVSHGVSTTPGGPRYDDVDLKVDGQQSISALDFSADVSAAVVFRMTENLFMIQDTLTGPARTGWAQGIVRDLPQTHTKIVDSPYTALLVRQSQELAHDKLEQIVPELKASPAKLRALLATMKPPVGPKENPPPDEAVGRLFKYLRDFDALVAKTDVHDEIKKGLHGELAKMLTLETRARADLKSLANAATIRGALGAVNAAAQDLKIDIPASTQPKIARGRALAARIDAIVDAHSALVALIEVWIYLTPNERIAKFKAASGDLYDYLSDMTMDDLRCLQDTECGSLPKWIARELFIEPKIDDYGVGKIRALLNNEGAGAVKSEVRAAVNEQVRGIPQVVGDRIEKQLLEKIAPIVRLQTDFDGEIRTRLDRWAAKNFEAKGPSVTTMREARAHVAVSPSGSVSIVWTPISNNTIENTGAFNGLAPVIWQEAGLKPESARSLILAKISTLAQAYESGPGHLPSDAQAVSARAYAETIRGLAGLANSFKEWQTSPLDELLGNVKAKDLFPEFEDMSELDQPLFPKAAFYAMSFHGLSGNLQSVEGDRSQVFLIDANNHIVRANEVPPDSQSAQGTPLIMAGIADRDGTELSSTVRAEDVARYLLAMCDVHEATKDVERSTSEILLKADKDGNIPRDQIVQSREKIRLLIVGLANFLSHQFRAGGELIHPELVIATQHPSEAPISVMDQALAIRALVAASDILGNDIYRWEAADLVSSMNRLLYRTDLGFYARSDEKSVSPVTLLETLRAFDAVTPHLAAFSRRQVEHVAAPWRAKIAAWKLSGAMP